MSTRDYTDSESDDNDNVPTPNRPFADTISAASTPRDMSPTNSSPTKPGASDHPVRITVSRVLSHPILHLLFPRFLPLVVTKRQLRPGLSHLADAPSSSDRASGSASPPRLKIKLGMKHALNASAIYSSSDDDDEKREKPPAKKQRTNKESDAAPSAAAGSSGANGGQQKPAHRKTYNWLAPSAVGTSHHGPEGRSERALSAVSTASPLLESESKRGSDNDSARGSAPPETKPKKSRRKAPAGDGGPGKNWRKGMRKYVHSHPRYAAWLDGSLIAGAIPCRGRTELVLWSTRSSRLRLLRRSAGASAAKSRPILVSLST